jgi:hypothetical protein
VHQIGPNYAGQKFSFLALHTAELALRQILSNNRRQRRIADGFFCSLQTWFDGFSSNCSTPLSTNMFLSYKSQVKISNKKFPNETIAFQIHMWKIKSTDDSDNILNIKILRIHR